MRKTILTVTVMVILAVTGSYASNNSDLNAIPEATLASANDGLNPFCKAIVEGDIEMVRKLITLGEDVNKKSLGMTPAIVAARYNKAEILQLLIDNGANLKIKSDKGYNAKKYAELSNAQEALHVINTAMES